MKNLHIYAPHYRREVNEWLVFGECLLRKIQLYNINVQTLIWSGNSGTLHDITRSYLNFPFNCDNQNIRPLVHFSVLSSTYYMMYRLLILGP